MKESNPAMIGERIGPLLVQGRLQDSQGAERFIAGAPEQRSANVWRWPADKLDALVVPSLALLIETLQDVEMAGVSQIVHGSVSTDHAVIAYARPGGQPLSDYVRRGRMSPVEAIASCLSLLDALAAMRAFGVRGAWWSPELLWVLDHEAQWTLAAPGLVAALRIGEDATVSDIAFRAPEAATVTTLADLDDEAYAAVEVYAVGATLYYVLSSQLPFDSTSIETYLAAQQSGAPGNLSDAETDLAPYATLVGLVTACLSADPSDRPESIEVIRRSLEDAEREARYQDSRVDFLPARVSETIEMSRPGGRPGEPQDLAGQERGNSMLPLLALVALIAIALFLIGR